MEHQVCFKIYNVSVKLLTRAALGFLSVAMYGTLCSSSLFASQQYSSRATEQDLSSLEESIWLQDVDKLRDRESDAARIVQINPDSTLGHYLLAQIYLRRFKAQPSQLKLLQQASDLGQQAIELDPTSDFGYLIAAQVLDMMGYSDSALNALEGDPKFKMRASWRVPFLKAQLNSGIRPDKEVESFFEASLSSTGAIRNIIVPYIIASIQSRHDFKSEMVEDLNQWRSKYSHRLFDLTLAIALTEQRRYSDAHQIYAKLQQSEPEFYEASINDSLLLYNHLGRTKEAQVILKNLLDSKRNLDTSKRLLAKAHLAKILIESGQGLQQGKVLLSEVINDSSNPNEWLIFGHKAFAKAKRLNEFIDFLVEIKRTLPGTGFIYALQGEVLSENLALHERAIESFHSAIILEPNRSDFYNGLGLAYYRMNEMQKALSIFHEATKVDPKDATSRYNEACVLALLGRPDEAIGSLRTAINLDPKLQTSAKSDSDFKSLWTSPDFIKLILPTTSDASPP